CSRRLLRRFPTLRPVRRALYLAEIAAFPNRLQGFSVAPFSSCDHLSDGIARRDRPVIGRRSATSGREIGEADLEVAADQHRAIGWHILEAVPGVTISTGDEEHAAERFVPLASVAGHREPTQPEWLAEMCE